MTSRGQLLLSLLTAVWLMSASAGLLLVADYDSKPGHPARPPQQWPSGVSLTRASTKPTVLMFLHPRCPCSRASLFELARLAHGTPDALDLHVVLVQPAEVTGDWSKSDLWEAAVANRDLQVSIDQGGELARQFGTQTSGQTLVYDRAGVLQFDGGITAARGHAGDSIGRSQIRLIAAGHVSDTPAKCATFGCPLSAKFQPVEELRLSGTAERVAH